MINGSIMETFNTPQNNVLLMWSRNKNQTMQRQPGYMDAIDVVHCIQFGTVLYRSYVLALI